MNELQTAFYILGITFMVVMLVVVFFAIGAFLYLRRKIIDVQKNIELKLLSLVRPSDVAKTTGMYFLRSIFKRFLRFV